MTVRIEFFKHSIDEESISLMNEVARSIFITTGPKSVEFEKKLSEYLGVPHSVGVMSCTHALHLAYLALGVGPGDEVIVPAFTFAATATSVLHAGAKPVFADVDPRTGILDPAAAEAAITPRTKAICPVHMYGVMAPMKEFARIAAKHRLLLVEDAAHCIEGKGDGFGPGQLSDAVAFSFYATKNITCGEGGALSTRSRQVADEAYKLRTHGMSKNAVDRYTGKFSHYDIGTLGYKYNLTDLQAALLLPQLAKIEQNLALRAKVVARYNEGLKDVSGIILPYIPQGYKSALHLYTFRLASPALRDRFLFQLIDQGVNAAVHYRPLARLTFFQEKLGMTPEAFPNATAIGDSTLTLPLYPTLKNEEVDYVINTVRNTARNLL